MKNANAQTVEAEQPKSAALSVLPRPAEHVKDLTPEQAKVDAIASLTMSAYAKASTLQFTPEERAKLAADFPDEAFKPGAAGKEHLIYIEHAFLRDRFNETFGPGQWAIIPRSRWAEPFTTKGSANKPPTEGTRVYVEAMLMIRGCFVAEAVGAMEYYPSNAGQDYSDAVEGAKTASLRRCAKELGVGLQAWKKDFGDGWWKRRREGERNSNTRNNPGASESQPHGRANTTPTPTARTANTSPQARPVAAGVPVKSVTPPCATEAQKAKFLAQVLAECAGDMRPADDFAQKCGWILPDTEKLQDLPLRFVPSTLKQFDLFIAALRDFVDGSEAVAPYPANNESDEAARPTKSAESAKPSRPVNVPRDEQTDPNAPDAPWRSAVIPYGKQKDTKLGELDAKQIYGWWANFEISTEYNGKPKKPDTIAKERAFRAALDAAGQHYDFKEAA